MELPIHISRGVLSQLSTLLIMLLIRVVSGGEHVYNSGITKGNKHRMLASSSTTPSRLLHIRQRLIVWREYFSWSLRNEVYPGWGTWIDWLCGITWTIFLSGFALYLEESVSPEKDYIRVTRRFGLIASAQLPLCVLLAMKSPWSPLQVLSGKTYAQLDSVHRILARVIMVLAALHAFMYLGFYIKKSMLIAHLTHPVVIFGLVLYFSFRMMVLLASAAVRNRAYRLFLVSHHILFYAVLVLLALHVHHARNYVYEAAAIYLVNCVLRFFAAKKVEATAEYFAGARVLKIAAPLATLPPAARSTGSYAYLATAHGPFGARLFCNPFTVAVYKGISSETVQVHARLRKGLTARFSSLPGSFDVLLEPYPTRNGWEPSLAAFLMGEVDRIVLVAGGIGATFALSVAAELLHVLDDAEPTTVAKTVQVLWVVRSVKDTTWANALLTGVMTKRGVRLGDVVTVYVTRGKEEEQIQHSRGDEEEDLSDLVNEEEEKLVGGNETGEAASAPDTEVFRRIADRKPGWSPTVEEWFDEETDSDSVGVMVCGPVGMRRDVRREVGRFVKAGRSVYWHEEAFGQ